MGNQLFEAIEDTSLRDLLSQRKSTKLTLESLEEVFLACCALIVKENWNQPGFTFILITNGEGKVLRIDNLELYSFVPGTGTSVSLYDEYLRTFIRHQAFLRVEFLGQDEEEEDEYINEVIIQMDEDSHVSFRDAEIRSLVLEALPKDALSPMHTEMLNFAQAVLKR